MLDNSPLSIDIRLRRVFVVYHLLFVLFVSDLVNDVDCGSSLRGRDGNVATKPTHPDQHGGQENEHVVSTRIVDLPGGGREDRRENEDKIVSTAIKDKHPTHEKDSHNAVDEGRNEHRPLGSPAMKTRASKNAGSYDKTVPEGTFWLSEGPKDSERPLLEFVMIVKNEAKSIVATIASVKPWVDRWTILDTGSTDGTKELIYESFKGVPGNLHDGTFVDFATTRNRALELAGHRCVFNLMLSGDETIQDGAAMRDFLDRHRDWSWVERGTKTNEQHEAYNMRIIFGSMVYDSTRIARTDAHWFYVGVTHEYMTNARRRVAKIRVESSTVPAIYHDLKNNERAHKMKRWSLDLDLLLGEWELHPNKTRTAFYVAQTYECLGKLENAFEWYETRRALGGWKEEAYEAMYRKGRVALKLKRPWPEVQQLWLDAHAYLPQRIEPLYKIASHYYTHGRNYQLAYLFASRAARIPYPTQLRLFISKYVYDYKVHDLLGIVAFYAGEYEEGRRSVLKALETKPGDKRLLRNLGYYDSAMAMHS